MRLNLPSSKTWDFLWSWLPPLLWGGVILSFSGDLGSAQNTGVILNWLLSWSGLLSPIQVDLLHSFLRKTGHAVAYGFLYFLWFRALKGYLHYPGGRACLWSLALCLTVAVLDEGHQSLLTSRSGSIGDVTLDLGGAFLAALITWLFWILPVRPPVSQ